MQYRKMKNGDKLFPLGFGGMRFPTKKGKIDKEKAEKQLMLAIDKGVNYIDTAYPYHKGQSESFIGEVIKKNGIRERVKLATKLPHWILNSKNEFTEMLDIQLNKLQTNTIDYYLIHMITNIESWERLKSLGIIEFIEESLKSGKIKNIGFSSHCDLLDFKQVIDDYDWDFCQIQFNILDENYQAGLEGLKYASGKGVPVIVMEPLRGGMLANNVPNDVRKIYNNINETAASVALRWIWNHPEVVCVLSGMNNEKHINENIETAEKSTPNHMTVDELTMIDQVKQIYKQKMKVSCTGCRYRMPCPVGVNIPGNFELYNNKYIYENSRVPKIEYTFRLGGLLGKDARASLCIECGECEIVCPQHIDIRSELKHVKKELEGPFTNLTIKVSRPILKMVRFFTKRHVKRKKKRQIKQ